MKKITQLCGFAFATIVAFASQATAQITITSADMPFAGLSVITAVDTPSTYAPGNPSATTQNWNFSGLKKTRTMTVNFMAPSSTKYASAFPGATLADSTNHGAGYYFFDVNSSQFAVVGSEQIINYSGFIFQVEVPLNPAFVQSVLPGTYGTKDNGVARGSEKIAKSVIIYDSEKVSTNITYFDTVDAFGTITLPTGTFNVLRQNHHEVDIDSITMRSSLSGTWGPPPSGTGITKSIIHQYNWYANGADYILVQMNMDSNTTKVENVIWDTTAIPAGINELSHNNKVSVFPNPCTNQISFMSTSNDVKSAYVYDIAGRQLTTVEMKNGMSILNTSTYESGMYIYTMVDKDGNMVDCGKFTVK